MNIVDIPIEILSHILEFMATKEDINNCSLVCKGWRNIMSIVRYREINIYLTSQLCLDIINGKLYDLSLLKKYTLNLEIWYDHGYTKNASRKDFYTLLSCFPNLRTLTNKSPGNIINYLIDTPTGLLDHIEEIKFDEYALHNHFNYIEEVYKRFSKTLETVKITNLYVKQNKDTSLIVLLNKMKRLKMLRIFHQKFFMNSNRFPIDSILSACPTLEHLWIVDSLKDVTDYYSSGPYLNVKRINIKTQEITNAFAEYMMFSLPNLYSFEFTFSDYPNFPPSIMSDQKKFLEFAEYIKQIPEVAIYDTPGNMLSDSHLSGGFFWSTVKYFQKELSLDLTIYFCGVYKCYKLGLNKSHKHFSVISQIWSFSEFIDGGWEQRVYDLRPQQLTFILHGFQGFSLDRMVNSIRKLWSQQDNKLEKVFIKSKKQIISVQPYISTRKCAYDHRVKYRPFIYIQNCPLTEKTLRWIGEVFPQIEYLILKNCRPHLIFNKNVRYEIDLTDFRTLCQLNITLDFLLKRLSPESSIEIELTTPGKFDLYRIDRLESLELSYLGDQKDNSLYHSAQTIAIRYAQLDEVVFKIFNTEKILIL